MSNHPPGTPSADPLEGSQNSLDHALLESLFYNEMALMDGVEDVEVKVEQDLLKDFGVSDRTVPITAQQQNIQHLSSGRGIRHNVVPAATQRNNMVSQFATLAERLGIDLPPQVLSKLTNQPAAAEVSNPAPSSSAAANNNNANSSNTLTEQLQTAATASIAAATSTKRKDENKLPYSKRRKKPRLDDCERRLAELQAENELLKKHLETISSQSQKLDQERKVAETKMRSMFHSNAPDSELKPAVHHFTEMYSDYGKKRHQELCFHLEQLQRLANPTNFTKMGLWTLAGESTTNHNPINSLLQKELNISPAQGRKILEQRQKIRTLCDNLKVTHSLLNKLQTLCGKKTQIFHDRMKLCEEILKPTQVVKLLLWIDENSQILGTVCPGWGSEQMQKSAAE